MPTNRTRIRRIRSSRGLTDWDVEYLLGGSTLLDDPPDFDVALIPQKWQQNKDWIMKWWHTGEHHEKPDDPKDRLGTRPWAWWAYDAPEERRKYISGDCDMLAWERPYFGVPTGYWRTHKEYVFESQYAYLKRHNLLTKEEKELKDIPMAENQFEG